MPTYEKLFDFAYIPDFERLTRSLAQKSQSESWSYDPAQGDLSILKNYINHTYKKIVSESKIAITASKACFNTGLFAPSNNEIFLVFTKIQMRTGSRGISMVLMKPQISF